MDLVRVILLKIEEEHAGVGLANLEVEGYDRATIAYHCQLLEEAGLVSSCIVRYADDSVFFFSVGGLTWEGGRLPRQGEGWLCLGEDQESGSREGRSARCRNR